MNVHFQDNFGYNLFATVSEEITGLIAALNVASIVKFNDCDYKVIDYHFEYIKYVSHEEPELTVIVKQIFIWLSIPYRVLFYFEGVCMMKVETMVECMDKTCRTFFIVKRVVALDVKAWLKKKRA